MIKIMPTVATLVTKGEIQTTDNGKTYSKLCFASEEQYIWCAVFGSTATYLDSYANVGAQVFLEDWSFSKKDKYYDFVVSKCRIVKNK